MKVAQNCASTCTTSHTYQPITSLSNGRQRTQTTYPHQGAIELSHHLLSLAQSSLTGSPKTQLDELSIARTQIVFSRPAPAPNRLVMRTCSANSRKKQPCPPTIRTNGTMPRKQSKPLNKTRWGSKLSSKSSRRCSKINNDKCLMKYSLLVRPWTVPVWRVCTQLSQHPGREKSEKSAPVDPCLEANETRD